jgi:hypothetical protein
MALEHPRRRGYPPGMGVDEIAHAFMVDELATERGRKTGLTAAFSDEARAPMADDSPTSGWSERELGSTFHRRKSGKRGRFRSLWKSSRRRRRPDSDSGALGQRGGDGAAWTAGRWQHGSDSREAGPARETAADRWAPHVSDFRIKFTPG